MITRMGHTCIYVLDIDSAYDFYVNKLGFKVKTDAPMGEGERWLTVCPPKQEDFEIVLCPVKEGMMFGKDKEKVAQLRSLIAGGTFGFGVLECDDIYATYEELKQKGVKFTKEPKEEFYGIEAIMIDDSGNWFSVGQKSK